MTGIHTTRFPAYRRDSNTVQTGQSRFTCKIQIRAVMRRRIGSAHQRGIFPCCYECTSPARKLSAVGISYRYFIVRRRKLDQATKRFGARKGYEYQKIGGMLFTNGCWSGATNRPLMGQEGGREKFSAMAYLPDRWKYALILICEESPWLSTLASGWPMAG